MRNRRFAIERPETQRDSPAEMGSHRKDALLIIAVAAWSLFGITAPSANPIHPESTPYLVRTLPTGGADIGGVAWHDAFLWTVDQSGVVRRLDSQTGAVLQTITTGLSTHNGLAGDEFSLWMTFDPGGTTQFSSVYNPGGVIPTPTSGARDMTIRQGTLWYADFDEGKIVEMLSNGTLQTQFPSPFGFAAQGLEWDGRHLLHTKHDGSQLLFIDPETQSTAHSMDLAPLGVKAGGGLAWDGEYLYIADFNQIFVVGFTPPPVPVDGVPFLVETFEYPGMGVHDVAWHKGRLYFVTQGGELFWIDPVTGSLNGPTLYGPSTHNGLGSTGDDLWMTFDPGGNTRFVSAIHGAVYGIGTPMDTPTSGARDITARNGNLWYADFEQGEIIEMTTGGALLGQFPSPFGFGAQGLEWDGAHLLHTSHDGDQIALIDPATGTPVDSIDLSGLEIEIAGGLAWEAPYLYAADLDRIYVIGFYSSGAPGQSAFGDDFEDSVFTERNWTQGLAFNKHDERWLVTSEGTFLCDNATTEGLPTPADTVAFANRLGCGAIQDGPRAGVTQYSANDLLMTFSMRAPKVLADGNKAFGAFVLVNAEHPTVYPGMLVGITSPSPGVFNSFIVRFNGLFPQNGDPLTFLVGRNLAPPFDPSEWHDYRVVVQDGTVYFSIDGAHQLSHPLPLLEDGSPMEKGATGLFLSQGLVVEYDDFRVGGEQVCETNTPVGEDVEIELVQGVSLTFDSVTTEGTTTVVRSQDPPEPVPDSLQVSFLGEFYDISTTAELEGPVLLTFNYDGSSLTEAEESLLSVLHYDETAEMWEDITIRPVDTANDRIQALTDGFSTFGIALPNLTAAFLEPLGPGTTSASPAGPFQIRRTLPIKFQLLDGSGAPVPDDVALNLAPQLRILLEREMAAGVPIDPGDNTGDTGSAFRYDAENDLFIFNLKTKGDAWSANRVYRAEVLIGGLVNGTAFFALK